VAASVSASFSCDSSDWSAVLMTFRAIQPTPRPNTLSIKDLPNLDGDDDGLFAETDVKAWY
jgi:hypothetical protein